MAYKKDTGTTLAQLMAIQHILTDENIKWAFIDHPNWEDAFLKHFPNFTPETYFSDAYTLLTKEYGFTFELTRMNLRPEATMHCVCGYIIHVDGKWLCEVEQIHESNIMVNWISDCLEEKF